ncbi:MAG: PorP/SprF family type IX secretion system membrane protein [Bacteroidales bacterium]
MKNRILVVIIGMLLFSTDFLAQKVQFSQFYAAPLVLSPSYTGLIDGSRIVLNYRDQWPNIPGTFTTYAASYDQYFQKMKSGIGISFVRDEAGTGNLNLTDIGLLYSYDITANRYWHVRPGIRFKYGQRGIDIAKLIFGSQLDLDGPPASSSLDHSSTLAKTGYIDVDASALAYHSRYWGGITVANLLRPNQSLTGIESRVPIKVSLFGGTRIPIKGNRLRSQEITESVTFTMLYQNQDGSDQLDLGAYWKKVPFTLGLWFRGIPVFSKPTGYEALDAVIVLIGYQIYDLRFGYSFDYTLSSLNQSATGGAHEVSIIYEFNKNLKIKQKKRQVVIPCPDF